LNSEEIIRLLCCASSGKSFHLLSEKKNFSHYFWIDSYHCGRIFHSSLLSMNNIFLARLSCFFALLGSINWNFLNFILPWELQVFSF
jgi:hypothetical protein